MAKKKSSTIERDAVLATVSRQECIDSLSHAGKFACHISDSLRWAALNVLLQHPVVEGRDLLDRMNAFLGNHDLAPATDVEQKKKVYMTHLRSAGVVDSQKNTAQKSSALYRIAPAWKPKVAPLAHSLHAAARSIGADEQRTIFPDHLAPLLNDVQEARIRALLLRFNPRVIAALLPRGNELTVNQIEAALGLYNARGSIIGALKSLERIGVVETVENQRFALSDHARSLLAPILMASRIEADPDEPFDESLVVDPLVQRESKKPKRVGRKNNHLIMQRQQPVKKPTETVPTALPRALELDPDALDRMMEQFALTAPNSDETK